MSDDAVTPSAEPTVPQQDSDPAELTAEAPSDVDLGAKPTMSLEQVITENGGKIEAEIVSVRDIADRGPEQQDLETVLLNFNGLAVEGTSNFFGGKPLPGEKWVFVLAAEDSGKTGVFPTATKE